MFLLKIAFPYWSNVCFGCDWHILTSELALLSVSQKDENPALFPVISIRCRLAHRPIPFLLLGSLGNDALKAEITTLVQIRLLTDFLCSQKHSKVSFELLEGFSVTAEKAAARYVSSNSKPCGLLPQALPPGCSSEVGQPVSDLRSFLYLKCFENITLLYLVFQNYRL